MAIFLRTVLIYIILISCMRLMGKRQIGELEVSDLVTTLLISEIATVPIMEDNVPIVNALIPIFTLVAFELLSSVLLVRFPAIKSLVSARPTMLINRGCVDRRAMMKVRISADELISELRQQGVTDISEVQYAILEQNGNITVIEKAESKQPTLKDLGIKVTERGIQHIAVCEGQINKKTLERLNIYKEDILKKLKKQKVELSDVYMMLIDDAGKVEIIKK